MQAKSSTDQTRKGLFQLQSTDLVIGYGIESVQCDLLAFSPFIPTHAIDVHGRGKTNTLLYSLYMTNFHGLVNERLAF